MEAGRRDGWTAFEPSELEGLTAAARGIDAMATGLFDSLVSAAEMEQRAVDGLMLRDTPAKRIRREYYLDPRRRGEWQARARDFLVRRSDVITSLPRDSLRGALMMQHLMDLEVANLSGPPELRHSEDTYTDGVNDQFLKDAPRDRYTLNGEVFHLADSRAQETREAFVARLVSAVRRITPEPLLALVTIAMSQSGMAHMERASQSGIAVFGGTQKVDYGIRTDPADADHLVVTMQARRYGFRGYCVAASDRTEPAECDVQSSILKSAKLTLGVRGEVDVIDFVEEVDVLEEGRRLSWDEINKRAGLRPTPIAACELENSLRTPIQLSVHGNRRPFTDRVLALGPCEGCARCAARGAQHCLRWVCCCHEWDDEARQCRL